MLKFIRLLASCEILLVQFQDLDPTVQEEFQSFLEERGINENLALLIPDYAQHKEQIVSTSDFIAECILTWSLKEYVRWLESVKRFIEH